MGTVTCPESLVPGRLSPQLYAASLTSVAAHDCGTEPGAGSARRHSLGALSSPRHRALRSGLNRGPITRYKTRSDIFNAESFRCREEQPCFAHVSTFNLCSKPVKQSSCSPTPLLRWKSFHYVPCLQDCRGTRAAAVRRLQPPPPSGRR